MADTATQQIEVMKNLSQGAAAWLLNVSPRSLRDWPEAPRSGTGGYDARRLVEWAQTRVQAPELTDDEYERVLAIHDVFTDSLGPAVLAVLERVSELQQRFGDGGLLLVAKIFLERWRIEELYLRELHREEALTDAQRRQQEEAHRRAVEQETARMELRVTHVCERCKRIRRGRRWQEGSPPPGFVALDDYCPKCERLLE